MRRAEKRSRDHDADPAIEAAALAEKLMLAAAVGQTTEEARESARLARLMEDEQGRAFTFGLVDAVFRHPRPRDQARRFRELLRRCGVPRFAPAADRLLLRLAGLAGRVAPGFVMPLVEARLRADCARVILPGEPDALRDRLEERAAAGFTLNLNHLGEAVLGEEEAARRARAALAHLALPHAHAVSVKISALYSQINLAAWDDTAERLRERLRPVFCAALAAGRRVTLDMESYRDFALTREVFQALLDEPEFLRLPAGLAIQAYLPDGAAAQVALTDWARARLLRGGGPVHLRLVKGANLGMEAVEAELHGWHPAPYDTKAETDANFRRMLEYGCRPEHCEAVRLGVASHNLFDLALALVLRRRHGVEDRVGLEMLEGMANHQARAVLAEAGGLLLYAPTARREEIHGALAYLVRRLDENTSPGNFLRDLFDLRPGPAWTHQREAFLQGWARRHDAPAGSRRSRPAVDPESAPGFVNQPDTDWTRADQREALRQALAAHEPLPEPTCPELESCLRAAVRAQPAWEALGLAGRAAVLREAARRMETDRFATLAHIHAEGRKAALEADVEVSEAIDFARYYSRHHGLDEAASGRALGVVVVAPPWNFPYAIPAGGVAAALMAGNSVVLKPAPETRGIAAALARQWWEAGVPRDALQFLPCADGETGKALITDPRVAAVILTGAWETARRFQEWRPSLRLFAETSGKNTLLITGQADRDQAIADLVRSAFGHAGQKCSAASLGIVEAAVYDDPGFQRRLRDAAASLRVGSATDPAAVVTPLIREPSENLLRALTRLEPGESWLLQPERDPHDPCLWSPGIRLGVAPGSWFHRTECFGPVLGLMRATSLEEAVRWANDTPYGLTAGLHSLDEDEIAFWRARMQAGNLYLNRAITGAVVQRQPFGGWKRSSVGPGAKAGGPNYVAQFRQPEEAAPGISGDRIQASYRAAWAEHYGIEHDPSGLRAESNVFRYRPCRGVVLRVPAGHESRAAWARLAAECTGAPLVVSLAAEESDEALAARLPGLAAQAEFLRTLETPSDALLRAAHDAGLNWIGAPLSPDGRVELRHWLREQTVARPRHRHGRAWL